MQEKPLPKDLKKQKPCAYGYLCGNLKNGSCIFSHTEQEKLYIEKLKYLSQTFLNAQAKTLIFGTVAEIESEKHIFTPLNKEMLKYTDLKFTIINQTEITLSEQHYYSALYLEQQSQVGELFVNLWGKMRNETDDIAALSCGQESIRKEKNEPRNDMQVERLSRAPLEAQHCKYGYLCSNLKNDSCRFPHTGQHKSYIERLKFLSQIFLNTQEKKFVYGTVAKIENGKHILTPLNKDITLKFPDLRFTLVNQTETPLSEQHYHEGLSYEPIFWDQQNKDGEFFVKRQAIKLQNTGNENNDIVASPYGQGPNSNEKNQSRNDMQVFSKVPKKTQHCNDGYLCQKLKSSSCLFLHTQQHKSYIERLKFLYQTFLNTQEKKLICGTVDKNIFTPLNKDITQKYSDLKFRIVNQTETTLSDQHYYEAPYLDKQSEGGEFFVDIGLATKWGKIGKEKDDIAALLYGRKPIYQEKNEFNGNFLTGILKEKFDGNIAIKCSSSQQDYFFFDELHKNRALVGSTVNFLEITAPKSNDYDKYPRKRQGAQVVSILKCPYDRDYIYGILDIDADRNNEIDVEHLYCPLPEKIDWDLLKVIFEKINKSPDYFKPSITKQDFIATHARMLKVNQQDPSFEYLAQLIFKTDNNSKGKDLVKRIWTSLYELFCQRKAINLMKVCFFKPLNKSLPPFHCIYIQEELKANPEIWRNYVMARKINWPSTSKLPWMRIESTEGLIGTPEADVRVILAKNNVKTDKFSKKVREQEEGILKTWEKNLDSFEKFEGKIFSIDGSSTKIRDDAFSIQKLSGEYEGCYEVGIHIADVTRVIKKDTEIFKEAKSRFCSCYIGKNFYKPMLPYNLQKHLNLQQGQLTYAFSIYILINTLNSFQIQPKKIKNK